jgi:hypothetical protein
MHGQPFFCAIQFARGLEQRQFNLQHAPPGPKIH